MKEACRVNYERRHTAGPFFGRLFLSIIFIISGLSKIFSFRESVNYLKESNIPGAEFFIIASLLLEIIGGILILLGWQTRLGSYLLMIFIVPMTLVMHGFWKYSGQEMQVQLAHFLKNLAIFGGLILLASFGPGRWSLDAKRCEKEVKNP